MLEKGAFLVPTMSTHEALSCEGMKNGLSKEMHDKLHDVVEAGHKTHAHASARGVKMVFGTDLLGAMHVHQLNEFKIRSAFQSPKDLIRSATLTAAELFQMEGDIGEVVEGAYADLIVVDGDPLVDIGVLQDPDRYLKAVIKQGEIFKSVF